MLRRPFGARGQCLSLKRRVAQLHSLAPSTLAPTIALCPGVLCSWVGLCSRLPSVQCSWGAPVAPRLAGHNSSLRRALLRQALRLTRVLMAADDLTPQLNDGGMEYGRSEERHGASDVVAKVQGIQLLEVDRKRDTRLLNTHYATRKIWHGLLHDSLQIQHGSRIGREIKLMVFSSQTTLLEPLGFSCRGL